MKRAALAILAAVALASTALPTYAHTLITDQTGTYGAMLHITPDDDPIAGRKATLYLDIQNDIVAEIHRIDLKITEQSSRTTKSVETQTVGSLVTADYTFPRRGVYEIRYDVDTPTGTYVFEQTIRVSRGDSAGGYTQARHSWATGLIIACSVALACLAIVAWNRRSDIARHSKF